ncbi:MAG TPA: polysaccharide biosynthesis tyrosine autokinase, partial [Armatimonadota bacterium]|nr:polysaccharide biosynthesis tyrosine autokinase [Armatimonadota bacterium]
MAVPATEERSIDLRAAIGAVMRRKWLILSIWIAVVVAAGFQVAQQTPLYRSQSEIRLQRSAGATSPGGETASLASILSAARQDRMWFETELATLSGGKVRTAAMDVIWNELPELRGERVASVTVSQVPETALVHIAATSPSPAMAQAMAEAIPQAYMAASQKSNTAAVTASVAYVGTQQDEAEAALNAVTESMREYKESHGVVNIRQEIAMDVGRVNALESALEQATIDLKAVRAEAQSVDEQRRAVDPAIVVEIEKIPDEVASGLRSQLVQFESDRLGLLNEYTEDSRKVRALDEQIARVRERLETEVQSIVSSETEAANPLLQTLTAQKVMLDTERVSLQAKIEAHERALPAARARLELLPGTQAELQALERRVSVAEVAYTSLLTQHQALKIAEASEVSNASWESRPSLPRNPVSPNRRQTLMAAAVLGLILGIVVAMVIERLDDRIRDPQVLESMLNTRLLGVIPEAKNESPVLMASPYSRSAFSESFSQLRSNLRFSSVNGPIDAMLVTSPGVSEGKSTISSSLATVAAQAGQKVILIDADLRRPSLHRALELDGELGLTNLLVGDLAIDDVLQDTPVEGLQVVTAGPLPPDPVLLLESAAMRRLYEQLKERCDLVIFDTPPALIAADAQILTGYTSAVLLVVDVNSTRQQAVSRAAETLRLSDEKALLGVAVNRVRDRGAWYYYYY